MSAPSTSETRSPSPWSAPPARRPCPAGDAASPTARAVPAPARSGTASAPRQIRQNAADPQFRLPQDQKPDPPEYPPPDSPAPSLTQGGQPKAPPERQSQGRSGAETADLQHFAE